MALMEHEEAIDSMVRAKQIISALMLAVFLAASVFAQKGRGGRGEDKRPPKKPDTTVIVKEKPPRPPEDKKQDGKKGKEGRRGRP